MKPQTDLPDNDKHGKAENAAGAVRALFIIYNNSRVYTTDHPVFIRTVKEHMSAFETALASGKELLLSFIKGQVRCGTALVEPGSTTFRAIAQTFEDLGLSGFCIHPGITAEEITSFVKAVTTYHDEIINGNLQKILENEKIKHITERKVSLQTEDERMTAAAGIKKPKKTEIKKTSYSTLKTFEIDDTGVDTAKAFAEPTATRDIKADREKPFREFAAGALSSLSRNKALVSEVTDLISAEFDERLNEKVEEVRKESKKVVRRLENVKSIVLQKLEAMHIMALLVDSNFNVLGMTLSAQDLLGNIDKIPHDSPLSLCVHQEIAEKEITLNDTKRTVHAIASETSDTGGQISLLTLE